ncbi:MAG: hypothetical protein J2O49_10995 [Sciscionella sp.]|nr:hypothetical protein [Sciscionella sp.]
MSDPDESTRKGSPIDELIPLRRRRTVTRDRFAAMSESAPVIDPLRFRADVDKAVGQSISDRYE